MALYELLHQLNIPYQEVPHAAVYTIKDAERLQIDLPGVEVKNLFIKDKTHYFLYCLPAQKRADLKTLRRTIKSGALTFAKEDELLEKLSQHAAQAGAEYINIYTGEGVSEDDGAKTEALSTGTCLA